MNWPAIALSIFILLLKIALSMESHGYKTCSALLASLHALTKNIPSNTTMPLINRPPTPHPNLSSHKEFVFPRIPKNARSSSRSRSIKSTILKPIKACSESRGGVNKRRRKKLQIKNRATEQSRGNTLA